MHACSQPRFHMWCRLLGRAYLRLDKEERKRCRKEFCSQWNTSYRSFKPGDFKPNEKDTMSALKAQKIYSFDDCTVAPTPLASVSVYDPYNKNKLSMEHAPCKAKQTTRNDDMYVSQDVTVTEKTSADAVRNHFLQRLSTLRNEEFQPLREKFGMEFTCPKTARELVAAIKAGEFTFVNDDDEDDSDESFSPVHYIRWTKKKKDTKGYLAATQELETKYSKFVDQFWAEADTSKYPAILEKFEKAIH